MKKKIFIDIDGVLINTPQRICDILNHRYKKNLNYQDIKTWDFKEYGVEQEEIEEIFDTGGFWVDIEKYIYPQAKDVLELLSHSYDIIAISIGSYENIANKAIFLREEFPMVSEFIGLGKKGKLVMDKSIIDMRGSTFIDDSFSNIKSSNASNKILFSFNGVATEWNNNLEYNNTCYSWEEVLGNISMQDLEEVSLTEQTGESFYIVKIMEAWCIVKLSEINEPSIMCYIGDGMYIKTVKEFNQKLSDVYGFRLKEEI